MPDLRHKAKGAESQASDWVVTSFQTAPEEHDPGERLWPGMGSSIGQGSSK